MTTVFCEAINKPIIIDGLLMMTGINGDGLDGINLDSEYSLIMDKKSSLSARKRGFVVQLRRKIIDDVKEIQYLNSILAENRLEGHGL